MRKRQVIGYKHIVLILGIIFISRNSWRDIPKYYKSMIFSSSLNALYYFLCRRHLVWEFTPFGIKWGLLRTLHIVLVTPLLVLTYLSKSPNSFFKQLIYTIKWVLVTSLVEYMAHKQKLILYAHRWNVFWSGFLFAMMFGFSKLFIKRPHLTLILSSFTTVFFIIKFKVPIRRVKHYSRYFEPLVDFYYHSFLKYLFGYMKYRSISN